MSTKPQSYSSHLTRGREVNVLRTSVETEGKAKPAHNGNHPGRDGLSYSSDNLGAGAPSIPSSLSVLDTPSKAAIESGSLSNPITHVDERVRAGSSFLPPLSHANDLGSARYCKGHGAIHRSHTDHNARDERRVHQGHR